MTCAQCCCICTLCISTCVAGFQLANYAVKLGEAVKESKEAADIKTSIELHVVPQPCVSERSWVDSERSHILAMRAGFRVVEEASTRRR